MDRIARYGTREWDMSDVSPEMFLNEALVPNYPDLRGATWTESTEGNRIIFEFSKTAGRKG